MKKETNVCVLLTGTTRTSSRAVKSDKNEALDEDIFCNGVYNVVCFCVPDQWAVKGFT